VENVAPNDNCGKNGKRGKMVNVVRMVNVVKVVKPFLSIGKYMLTFITFLYVSSTEARPQKDLIRRVLHARKTHNLTNIT
jgi:hypothetical protein